MVQVTTYTLLAKLLSYLCTSSIPYLFLASLNTQDSVLRTSRQSFWHQDYTPHPHGTESKVNMPFIYWARLLQTVLYQTQQTSIIWQHGRTCLSAQPLLDINGFFFVVHMPATASQRTSRRLSCLQGDILFDQKYRASTFYDTNSIGNANTKRIRAQVSQII